MKITKGTIIRTIMIIVVIINIVFERYGIDLIRLDKTTVGAFVETAVEIAAIVASWWYNNSLTENARKADEYLQQLKESKAE